MTYSDLRPLTYPRKVFFILRKMCIVCIVFCQLGGGGKKGKMYLFVQPLPISWWPKLEINKFRPLQPSKECNWIFPLCWLSVLWDSEIKKGNSTWIQHRTVVHFRRLREVEGNLSGWSGSRLDCCPVVAMHGIIFTKIAFKQAGLFSWKIKNCFVSLDQVLKKSKIEASI